MSGQWKPGDVAVIEVGEDAFVGADDIPRFMDELIRWWPKRNPRELGIDGGTAHLEFLARAFRDVKCGRLVVIDPEDREQVKRLADVYDNTPYSIDDGDAGVSEMQAALREFANPTPPKPEEPTGLGAVVEATCGCQPEPRRFVRHDDVDPNDPWEARCGWHIYADLYAVKVLSEGVTP